MSIQADFAKALADPGLPSPLGLTTSRGEPDPARLAVYRNNVYVSLVAVLERSFPVTRKVVGAAFFAATARVFAGENKPQSPVLATYGEGFAGFLSRFPPAASLPYLSDLARLEFAWLTAYHAADAEPIGPQSVLDLDPDTLAEQTLIPHPATHFLQSGFPVGSIWAAHQKDPVPRVIATASEAVLVTRPSARVQVTILPQSDVRFVRALVDGATVGAAFEQAARHNTQFDFGTALLGLVRLGAFGTILQPGVRPL